MGSLERSDNILKAEYGPRGPGELHRFGRASAPESEEPSPKGDLSRLRQLLGPEPEVVHVPQPTRRAGWFASGFVIALVLGVVIGLVAIVEFPALFGKGSSKNTEFTSRFDSTKPQEASAPAVAAAPAAAPQSNPQAAIVAVAPTAAPPAGSAPGRVANLGGTSEPAPAVRGITDTEIRFGMSAPFSGPAKELGQNMKLGIEAAFSVVNAKGGVFGRKLRLIAADDGYEPARTAAAMKDLYERDQVF